VAFTPEGAALVTLDRNGVSHFWDPADGAFRYEFGGGQSAWRPLRLVFSPDGESIVAPLSDGTVQIRDTAAGQVVATLAGRNWPVVDAAFSPDGRMLVTGEMINRQLEETNGAQATVWERHQ
jgi:WD40 repeat protein